MISHRGQPVDRLFMEPVAKWFVGTVRSRSELVLAEKLASMRVSYYLPYEETRVRSGNQYHKGVRVLLDGFIFFIADDSELFAVKDQREIGRVIPVKDQKLLVQNLVDFHSMRIAAKFLRLEALQKLKAGDKVRVREGYPAAGVEGVVDTKDKSKIFLRVGMLGAASFSIQDPASLELIK